MTLSQQSKKKSPSKPIDQAATLPWANLMRAKCPRTGIRYRFLDFLYVWRYHGIPEGCVVPAEDLGKYMSYAKNAVRRNGLLMAMAEAKLMTPMEGDSWIISHGSYELLDSALKQFPSDVDPSLTSELHRLQLRCKGLEDLTASLFKGCLLALEYQQLVEQYQTTGNGGADMRKIEVEMLATIKKAVS
jgi:hypothetical protein